MTVQKGVQYAQYKYIGSVGYVKISFIKRKNYINEMVHG